MTQVLAATGALFRDRELFVHDGSKLRRFRVSAPVQTVFFMMLVGLIAWSGFATARMMIARPQAAGLSDATEARARMIEQRQALIEAAPGPKYSTILLVPPLTVSTAECLVSVLPPPTQLFCPSGMVSVLKASFVAEIVSVVNPVVIKRQDLQRRQAVYAGVTGRPSGDVGNEVKKPVVVFFAPVPFYPRANLRHYCFLVGGIPDLAEDLEARGVGAGCGLRPSKITRRSTWRISPLPSRSSDAGALRERHFGDRELFRVVVPQVLNQPGSIEFEDDVVDPEDHLEDRQREEAGPYGRVEDPVVAGAAEQRAVAGGGIAVAAASGTCA